MDLATLQVIPKAVRPLEKQLPNESRKLWENVTSRLHKKEYGDATKHKLIIEQRQRDEASERKRTGKEHVQLYFILRILADSGPGLYPVISRRT